MKKIMILFAALFAALSFSSCHKEQFNDPSRDGFDIDISVADFNGPGTRAVKTGWSSGDRLFIWLDSNLQANPDLVIKYNGSGWVKDTEATLSGNAPASSSGDMMVAYVAADNLPELFSGKVLSKRTFAFSYLGSKVDKYYPFILSLSVMARSQYTYADNTIKAAISGWSFPNDVQVVVSGLTGEWVLFCDEMQSCGSFTLDRSGDAPKWTYDLANLGYYVYGADNADGKAFYFTAGSSAKQDYTFTLINVASGEKYQYTASGKSLETGGSHLNNIKIPFSKFSVNVAVDLGLSVKWAVLNVGATKPEEYGDYFAWGETEPYYEDGDAQKEYPTWKLGKEAGYFWYSYKWTYGSYNTMNKYCTDSAVGRVDDKTVLEPEDDVAHVKWGGNWRMPTVEEWAELLTKCTWSDWIADYKGTGVSGYTVTGSNGNYIFLPAAGARIDDSFGGAGSVGYYWSSSLDLDSPLFAWCLFSYSDGNTVWDNWYRYYGLSVRPVSE